VKTRNTQLDPAPSLDLAARLQRALLSDLHGNEQSEAHPAGKLAHAYPVQEIPPSGRRSSVYTPEVIKAVLSLIESGLSEKAACLEAGVHPKGWPSLKMRRVDLREAVNQARKIARKAKLEKDRERSEELRSMRTSTRPAKRPTGKTLPKDINMIRWHLVSRVSLDFAHLDKATVENACAIYGTAFERWRPYDEKHKLLEWIYAKRARMRGEHLLGKAPQPENLSPRQRLLCNKSVRTIGVGFRYEGQEH
jgi:hypothetical protein